MKYMVNEAEQIQIKEAIEAFEKQSSAEIVTVIAKQSDGYFFIPLLYAAAGALGISWAAQFFTGGMGAQELAIWQILSFVLLALCVQIRPVKMALIPETIKKKRAAAAAKSHFFSLGLHATNNRAGVMLFVSEAEKYVEIITDVAVAQKIDNALWEEAVQNFIMRVKEGNIAQGYLETIQKAAALLTEHFPHAKAERDELPNHLILVE